MLSRYKYLFFTHKYDTNRKAYLQLRPNFAPRLALIEPTRAMVHVFTSNPFQPLSMRPVGKIGPHGKDYFMTFNRDQYRDHIAPLKLPREQEDKLLDDLWALSEALVDQSLTSPFYPLQLALTSQAFDAVERAIVLESKLTPEKKEKPCP